MAASQPPVLDLQPPLLNSASPWATTLEELRTLYSCTSTGAVTTRTSVLKGFDHDPASHQYIFFRTADHSVVKDSDLPNSRGDGSLNSLGYSPIPLLDYLHFIETIANAQPSASKYFIISVIGTPAEVAESYRLIASSKSGIPAPLAMEINLSCPNIPGAPPPAYSESALAEYLAAVSGQIASNRDLARVPFGIKTPPYTHATEYQTMINALLDSAAVPQAGGVAPLSFITATNTLGSCLVIGGGDGPESTPLGRSLPGHGMGGMAGAPLHPLALGNVMTISRMLREHYGVLGHVRVIGVGGVLDPGGYRRMMAAGASAVAVGTGLGLKGVGIFREIEDGLGGCW